MIRPISAILGVGLVILWIAGLSTSDSPAWLNWLDLVAAVCAFIVAGATPEATARVMSRVAGSLFMAVGLFVLWIVALVTAASNGMAWWNFAFGCAFTLLAIYAGVERRSTSATPFETQFRKTA